MERSPHWQGGHFLNFRANWIDYAQVFRRALFGPTTQGQQPGSPISAFPTDKTVLANRTMSGLRVTWFGHSSVLIEIDGKRVLTDPIWSDRASPVVWAGPKRWFAPTISLSDLPPIDAVVISHDHYDHLDRATIQALGKTGAMFIVPLGIGADLAYWGIPEARIVELDWWETARLGDFEIVASPARHASGRLLPSSDRTLWAGYALIGPRHRVWYSGDTGFQPEFARIGRDLGPFDLTLIEAGQYDPAWPDNHLSPEMVIATHRLVRGKLLLPVHWGLFSLAPHGWTEPVERVLAAARCNDVSVVVPRPGQSFEPARYRPTVRWWPDVPWQSSAQKPVLATVEGDPRSRFPSPSCRKQQ